MDGNDLNNVMKTLKKEKKNPNSVYMVRALTPVGWRTLKSYMQEYSKEQNSAYWTESNRISDNSTVSREFYQFQITIKY